LGKVVSSIKKTPPGSANASAIVARYWRATVASSRAALADELLQGLLRIGHRAQGGRQAHPARERLNRFAFPLH
jgi:hypothetical protein